MSIIQTVDYTNTRISIAARANAQNSIIMPLNLFTAIQIPMCLNIWTFWFHKHPWSQLSVKSKLNFTL